MEALQPVLQSSTTVAVQQERMLFLKIILIPFIQIREIKFRLHSVHLIWKVGMTSFLYLMEIQYLHLSCFPDPEQPCPVLMYHPQTMEV